MENVGLLTLEEIQLGKECIAFAKDNGASSVRITLNKSLMDSFANLDGKIDKVSHCLDRSINLNLYVDGKYGTFSSNRLDKASLEEFILKAIDTVRMLAEDEFRVLPSQERVEAGAKDGCELNLYDPEYERMTSQTRKDIAIDAMGTGKSGNETESYKVISEEGEYSDSVFDTVVIDSDGTFCRHKETSFEYGVEVTILDNEGNKISGFWWDAAPYLKDLDAKGCFEVAKKLAADKINPKKRRSGKYNLVVKTDCASKVVTPILNALGAFAIQQNNSFLIDSVGKRIFSDGMTITDDCRVIGKTGSRLFDSEGVATKVNPVIENGVVNQYFVNTYMSGKLGIDPTNEDIIRPRIEKYLSPDLGSAPENLDYLEIIKKCKNGILVTGFNGGNSNSSTGDFSYGIEGFAFKNGKITHPVREMLVTGNFITLWNNLLACGNDSRDCSSRAIPTLAFKDVDFSA